MWPAIVLCAVIVLIYAFSIGGDSGEPVTAIVPPHVEAWLDATAEARLATIEAGE